MAVPGALVSPGTSNCNLTRALAMTVMGGLVLAALLPSVASEAVKVWLPPVLKVTFKVWVPELSAVFDGRTAFASLEVMVAVSVTVVTGFQKASTALTVTLKAVLIRQLGEILKALDTGLEVYLAPEIGAGARVKIKFGPLRGLEGWVEERYGMTTVLL